MENNFVEEKVATIENEVHSEVSSFKRDYAPHRRSSIRICKECGEAYVISDNDIIYFVKKFGTIPLNCEKCRAKKIAKRVSNVEVTDEQVGE